MLGSLKEKPEDVKKKVALFIAGICSIVIFAVWLRFTIRDAQMVLSETENKGSVFFSKIKENTSSFYKDLSGQFGSIKEQFSDIKKYQAAQVSVPVSNQE